MRVEVAGARSTATDARDRPRRCDGLQPAPEAGGDEPPIARDGLGRDERRLAAAEDEDARVHGRRWLELAAREASRNGRLVERAPRDAVDRARPGAAALQRDPPLDDEIRTLERRRRVVEEQAQQVVRPVEGQVRDDPERRPRERDGRRVALDHRDVRPAPPEPTGQPRGQLACDHVARPAGALGRDPPAARTEVEDEGAGPDAGVAAELGCESASESVLTTRERRPRARWAWAGHGSPVP